MVENSRNERKQLSHAQGIEQALLAQSRGRKMALEDKIRPYRDELISAHTAGDEGATQVIKLYQMHCASPSDPGAPAFCEAAFDKWLEDRKAGA